MFYLNGKKKCPNCEEKQYTTTKSNRNSFYWALPPSFLIILLNSFGVSFLWIIPIALVSLLICQAIMPSFMEFTDTQQPIF